MEVSEENIFLSLDKLPNSIADNLIVGKIYFAKINLGAKRIEDLIIKLA